MRAQDIKEILDAELVGNKFDLYDTYYKVVKLLREMTVEKLGWSEGKASFINNGIGRMQSEIYYAGYPVGIVRITKKRGSYHSVWGSGYYDWTITGVKVLIYSNTENQDETFEDRITFLQGVMKKDREDKETKLSFAKEAYKAVRSKFPDYSYLELSDLVKLLKDKLYDFYSEETKKD